MTWGSNLYTLYISSVYLRHLDTVIELEEQNLLCKMSPHKTLKAQGWNRPAFMAAVQISPEKYPAQPELQAYSSELELLSCIITAYHHQLDFSY